MGLSPYTDLTASGVVADSTTETYDYPSRGRRGLLLVTDVTAIGNGHSFVQGAAVSLPVTVVAATNDVFNFNSLAYTVAPGTYTTLAQLATAVGAALHTATAFSTIVTVTPSVTGLLFTNVASGVHAEAFATGATDILATLGITTAWTIAHTQAAGADGAFSSTVTIQGKDEASGKFYDILSGAAIASISTQVLQVHPEMVASANLIAESQLPANIRVKITHTTNNAVTRTVGLQLTS